MTDPMTEKTRPARWMRPVLVVSLALNLLILGAVGAGLTLRGPWSGHERHGGFAGGPMTRALNDEDRRAIGRQMRAAYDSGALAGKRRGADFDALLQDIRAQPFDPARLAQRMAERQEAMRAHLDLSQRLLVERLTAMTDAERAAFADRLAQHRGRHN